MDKLILIMINHIPKLKYVPQNKEPLLFKVSRIWKTRKDQDPGTGSQEQGNELETLLKSEHGSEICCNIVASLVCFLVWVLEPQFMRSEGKRGGKKAIKN